MDAEAAIRCVRSTSFGYRMDCFCESQNKYSVLVVYSEMRIQGRHGGLCSKRMQKKRVKTGRDYNFDIVGCILLRYADATSRPVRFSMISHRALMIRQPIATDVLMIRRYEPSGAGE